MFFINFYNIFPMNNRKNGSEFRSDINSVLTRQSNSIPDRSVSTTPDRFFMRSFIRFNLSPLFSGFASLTSPTKQREPEPNPFTGKPNS